VLVIEDTSSLQMIYRALLGQAGYQVRIAATAAAGMALFRETPPDVVLIDLQLPDRDGLSLLRDMLTLRPETPAIVVTAHGSVNVAVEAMRAGAHDFLVKPVEEARLMQAVAAARQQRRAAPAARAPAPALPADMGLLGTGLVGTSALIAGLDAKIASVARSMATVFLTGESGTGKEVVAQAIHARSSRAGGPFIALNCGAIPADLLDSEVFGHVKGSFAGAVGDKPGAALSADGGTLFLDEICEMAPPLQTRLLRFLQSATVQPIGAARPRKVDVRIICATNRDPLDAVRRGQFREDLYYRLHVVPLHMPPLRERGDDVAQIAEAALARLAAEEGKVFQGFAPETVALLRRCRWPGNIRQLLNVIHTIVVLNDGGTVVPSMLPDDILHDEAEPAPAVKAPLDDLMGLTLADVERRVITATLARYGGSVLAAARALDVAPSTLYRKLDAWAKG
jgi:DNA-binding NtrC family response regulator